MRSFLGNTAFLALIMFFAFTSSKTIVALLLGYAGITQFFPDVVLGLFWRRANLRGVSCGLVIGIATVSFLMLTGRDPFMGLNAGFVAMVLNFLVTVLVCYIGSPRANRNPVGIEA